MFVQRFNLFVVDDLIATLEAKYNVKFDKRGSFTPV